MNVAQRSSQRGAALTIAIIVIIIVSLLVVYALSAGFHQALFAGKLGGASQIQRYWTARAGVVDATWRIRHNVVSLDTGELGSGAPGNSFVEALFDPPTYYLDLDTDQTSITPLTGARIAKIDIGPVNTGGGSYPTDVRKIESTAV